MTCSSRGSDSDQAGDPRVSKGFEVRIKELCYWHGTAGKSGKGAEFALPKVKSRFTPDISTAVRENET
jgi:hypothetical protein